MDTSGIDLSGQTAVVTGASRGIGREISLQLARAGAHVVAMARSTGLLNGLVKEIRDEGGKAQAFALDVGNPESVKAAFEEAEKVTGSVELLVNNAGISGPAGNFWEADAADWWKVQEVNVRGVFLCSKAVIPGMIDKGRGRIINIGSGIGTRPFPEASAYCVSKASLFRLSDTMAEALEEHNIAVFTISPGMVKTDMTREMDAKDLLPKNGWTPVELAAQLCVYLASGKADLLTGRYIHSRNDDVEKMVQEAAHIVDKDLHALRMR